ncbi:MAG TPA: bacteriohemerythrin [Symbiobacteriaceae bacterium]|nr:bacteriohemerythrin [Symbiobacteriaceae bacterium]
MLVQWQESLAIGVAEVDAQHKEIFHRVNGLLTAMQEGRGRQEVAEVIDFLGKYVVAHFAAEEKVMSQHGFPGYAAHRQKHAAFVADFMELKRELDAHGTSSLLVIQVQRRVVEWLVGHISKEDRQIAEFIRSK